MYDIFAPITRKAGIPRRKDPLTTAFIFSRVAGMKGLRLCILSIGIGVILGAFSACGILGPRKAVLWTDKPEFAFYAEQFNVEHPSRTIIVKYKNSPADAFLKEAKKPDLITAEELPSRKLAGSMSSLKKLIKKDEIRVDEFYPALMELCRLNNDTVMLPVRFSLPAIFLSRDIQSQGPESFFINADTLALGENNSATFMSFSPSWDRNFLLYFTLAKGADFREAPNGRLAWNDSELKKGIRILKDWNSALNEKNNAELVFTDKYLNEPGYMLVNGEKISYFFSDVKSYFEIPRDKRQTLDFRCYGEDNKVLVTDDTLYIGIPRKSLAKTTARAFLVWFYSPKNQRSLIELSQTRRIRTFGLVQGLSAEKDLTEKDLPRLYPALAGRIPTPDYLKAVGPLPADWKKLKMEVILPWLSDEVKGNGPEPLESLLTKWYQRKPE